MSDYAFVHEGQAFTPDGRLPAATDADAHNRDTEAREIAWLKTAPERVFLYVTMPAAYDSKAYPAGRVQPLSGTRVHTWLGTDVATNVVIGMSYTIRGGFGTSRRRSVSCRIFGVRYVGTYYESSGDYCRLRKAKRQ